METKEFAVKRGRDNEEEEIEGVESNGGKTEPSRNKPRLEMKDHGMNNMSRKNMSQDTNQQRDNAGTGTRERKLSNGEQNGKISNHARFVYIKSEMKDVPMTKANPFRVTEAIKKVVKGDVKKVKPLKSGDLLVEASNKAQVESLCKLKQIGEMPVSVRVARQFNITKGVIFAPCLLDMEELEIVEELKSCKVVQAKFINKGPARKKTPLIILTFDSNTLPTEIKCGYHNVRVDRYIPPPLRCFKCNGFGHTASVCKKSISCTKCAEEHVRDECINRDIRCSNCNSEEHGALDRNCPVFKKEKEIINMKITHNITYFEAKKRFESQSYAAVVTNNAMDNGNGVINYNANKESNNTRESETVNSTISMGNDVNVGASTSAGKQPEINESEMECGAVGSSKNDNAMGKGDIELISLIINLTKIIKRNPGKITIQARQISNLIYKTTQHKVEICDVVKALQ